MVIDDMVSELEDIELSIRYDIKKLYDCKLTTIAKELESIHSDIKNALEYWENKQSEQWIREKSEMGEI